MSAGANGRQWFELPKSERENVDPTADYVSADAQIVNTVGVHMKESESPEDRKTVREADSETTRRVIEAFERPRKVGRALIEQDDELAHVGRKPEPDDYLPKFEDDGGPPIPGKGERGDDCGDDLARFCDCCGETTVVGRTCGLSRCPRCWTSWCRDLAVNKASRLAVTRAIRDANREEQQFYHHLAWSPPPGDWALQAEDPLRRTKQAINEILDEMDLDAVCIYHAWRGAQEDDDDRGEWAKRLSEEMDWEDVRDEVKFSPHFHVIAVGSHVPGGELTRRVQEETGWSLHRITKGADSKVSLYDNSDMVSAIEYSISHATLKRTETGNNSVQMWQHGDIMNQKFVKESELDDDVHPDEVDDLVITEETEEEMDLLARAHAPLTLGVEMDSVLCTEEFVNSVDRETGADRAGVRTLIDIGTGDTRKWTPASNAASTSTDGASSTTGESSASTELATAGATTTEVDDLVHNREGDPGPTVETCQGRMLPIWEAPNYIGDQSWRASADHVDQLDATWTDWKPRLAKMLDNFG